MKELDYLLFLSLVIIFVMLLWVVWFMMSGQPLSAIMMKLIKRLLTAMS